VDGRGRAGQVVDLVYFKIEREGHVVANELKAWVRDQVFDVLLGAGEEVVHADDFAAFQKEAFTEV
jgi:hypothetical protein